MTEGSGLNKTQIWVTVITVAGGLLTAVIVNADKWVSRDPKPGLGTPPAPAMSDRSVRAAPSPDSSTVDLSGEWRDDDGSRFNFTQSGSSYEYTHTAVNGTLQSRGKGTISGRDLSHKFETPTGDSGVCSARVNAAANRIAGSCVTRDAGWTFVIER